MEQINGTFQGKVTMQTAISIPNKPLHALVLVTIAGDHSSATELWNGARLTYWSMGDLLAGEGKVSGYFHNKHVSGDTTFGTFEAEVAMKSPLRSTTIGTWKIVYGTGGLKGISGGGEFESQSETPITVKMTWSGGYSLGG